ncbi:MAG: hypothetical protein HRU43_07465, partial [Simkaniaceae bacterium]|nr:hypothetical protein [Simkaniaceae bacterium]
MALEKLNFNRFNDRIFLPTFFVTAAFFAGSKRTIHLFEGSCSGGLVLSAIAGSVCVSGAKTSGGGKQLHDLAKKCVAIAIAVIASPVVCKLLAERISLSFDASLKFGMVEA